MESFTASQLHSMQQQQQLAERATNAEATFPAHGPSGSSAKAGLRLADLIAGAVLVDRRRQLRAGEVADHDDNGSKQGDNWGESWRARSRQQEEADALDGCTHNHEPPPPTLYANRYRQFCKAKKRAVSNGRKGSSADTGAHVVRVGIVCAEDMIQASQHE